MRKLNFIFLLTALTAILLTACVSTQLPESLEVSPDPLEVHGGKIAVQVDGTIPEKSFHKKAQVELSPVIRYDGGEVALKKVYLKGEKAEGEGTVISKSEGGKLSFSDEVDYTTDMNASELIVKYTIKKNGTVVSNGEGEMKIADGVIYTSRRVKLDGNGNNVAIGEHGYEKVTLIDEASNLYFAYNKSNLNKNLELNKNAKEEMQQLSDFIANGYDVKEVIINAWASPEGEQSLNQELSSERSETTEDYTINLFKKLIKEKESKIKIEDPKEELTIKAAAKGEDYDGFMKALNASNIKEKETIKNVINSQATKAERETRIKQMKDIYEEVDEMLAVLRRGEVNVVCFEPKRSDENIAQLSTTYPDSLDIKELLYAATLTDDIDTKLKIYNNAISNFPNDWRGYNNAGAIQIQQSDMDNAKTNIEKANSLAPNTGEVLNNLGVVAAYEKDYDKAKEYYSQAAEKGISTTYNDGVMAILDGNYDDAISKLNSYTGDYNLALAQTLKNDESTAKKTLEENKTQCAEAYYLLAVIGARTNDVNMLVTNLIKAIDTVPSYKTQAVEDREFLKYLDNTLFKNAVK